MKLNVDTEELVKLEIITPDTARKLVEFAREQVEQNRNRGTKMLSVMLAILTSILIGSGIIVLLAHNWEQLAVSLRLACSFTPLLLAIGFGAYTLMKRKGRAFTEASCIFCMSTTTAALALVSQIYNLNGELADFMTVVLFTSLLFIVVFNSESGMLLYCAGFIVIISGISHYSELNPLPLILLVLLPLPRILWNYYRNKSSKIKFLWRFETFVIIMISIAVNSLFCSESYFWQAIYIFTTFSAGFILCYIPERGLVTRKSFDAIVAMIVMIAVLAIHSYPDFNFAHYNSQDILPKPNCFFMLPFLLIFTLIISIMKRSMLTFAALLLPAVWAFSILVQPGNFFLFYSPLFAGLLLRAGAKNNSLLNLNFGMVLGIIIFFEWFIFDGDTIIRGLSMIAAGILLAMINFVAIRRMRRANHA